MIQGVVNAAYEPVITLALQGPSGQSRDIEAVVDTGFNGFLTLPTVLVSELGLPFVSIGRATLADGSEIAYDVYGATALWDGHDLNIQSGTAGASSIRPESSRGYLLPELSGTGPGSL